MLTIRVDDDLKTRLERAAESEGASLSSFVLSAAEREAAKIEKRAGSTQAASRTFKGVPTFFRAVVATAQSGGERGYAVAGSTLARHLESLAPDDLTPSEWEAECDQLVAACKVEDTDEVCDWFQTHLPACFELVPERRHVRFAEGVIERVNEHGI